MEEVAATKISGEEDRYSHTDLWDFRGNFDGAYKIVELVRPLIADQETEFLKVVDDNFARVDTILDKYRDGEGYVSYEELTDADRNVLSAAVNKLAEDLSTLRGKLGLD
jgi:iron uptake system component EfeO